MSVTEKAKELAELIKETEEFESLKSAEARLKLDPKAQELIQQYQDKTEKVQNAREQGGDLDQSDIMSIQNLQGQMEQNETIKNLMDAQKNFEQMMQKVNNTLSENLR